jgi:hypothetical protein
LDSFSWGNAWSFGYQAVARRAWHHCIILVGIGILVPLVVQIAVSGTPTEALGPLANGPADTTIVGGISPPPLAVAGLLSFLLQTTSYFGSWRVSLAENEAPGRALLYGLLAGLIAVPLVAALLGLVVVAGSAAPEGLGVPVVMILAIPLLIACAAFFSLASATIAVAVGLMLLIAMIGGMAMGQTGFAATIMGGSGVVVVMAIVLSGILLWLAARLCCTTAIMAESRSFNPIAAIRISWDLTWDEQWAILRYLATIGLMLAIVTVALGAAATALALALMQMRDNDAPWVVQAAAGLIAGLPIAFLMAMATPGIYRELNPAMVNADVFA